VLYYVAWETIKNENVNITTRYLWEKEKKKESIDAISFVWCSQNKINSSHSYKLAYIAYKCLFAYI